MKAKAIVGNIGHFDNEIDMAGLKKLPGITKVNIKPQYDEWQFPDGGLKPAGYVLAATGTIGNDANDANDANERSASEPRERSATCPPAYQPDESNERACAARASSRSRSVKCVRARFRADGDGKSADQCPWLVLRVERVGRLPKDGEQARGDTGIRHGSSR